MTYTQKIGSDLQAITVRTRCREVHLRESKAGAVRWPTCDLLISHRDSLDDAVQYDAMQWVDFSKYPCYEPGDVVCYVSTHHFGDAQIDVRELGQYSAVPVQPPLPAAPQPATPSHITPAALSVVIIMLVLMLLGKLLWPTI